MYMLDKSFAGACPHQSFQNKHVCKNGCTTKQKAEALAANRHDTFQTTAYDTIETWYDSSKNGKTIWDSYANKWVYYCEGEYKQAWNCKFRENAKTGTQGWVRDRLGAIRRGKWSCQKKPGTCSSPHSMITGHLFYRNVQCF